MLGLSKHPPLSQLTAHVYKLNLCLNSNFSNEEKQNIKKVSDFDKLHLFKKSALDFKSLNLLWFAILSVFGASAFSSYHMLNVCILCFICFSGVRLCIFNIFIFSVYLCYIAFDAFSVAYCRLPIAYARRTAGQYVQIMIYVMFCFDNLNLFAIAPFCLFICFFSVGSHAWIVGF